MAHLDLEKPVYVFILKTADSQWDNKTEEEIQDILRNKKILKNSTDSHCTFAISGSSLPLGCWTSPKFAVSIAKGG